MRNTADCVDPICSKTFSLLYRTSCSVRRCWRKTPCGSRLYFSSQRFHDAAITADVSNATMAPPEDTFSMSVMMIPKDVQTDNCGQAFPVGAACGHRHD